MLNDNSIATLFGKVSLSGPLEMNSQYCAFTIYFIRCMLGNFACFLSSVDVFF